MEKTINAYKTLVEKLQWKKSRAKSRHGWEDNIKMNLRETVLVNVLMGFIYKCVAYKTNFFWFMEFSFD
jgi:hypothetical protein